MPQISRPNGILLGNAVYVFAMSGDPNTADPAANETLVTANLSSKVLRYDTGQEYRKTATPTQSAPTGTWTEVVS
jgi:hypothetical protein